MVKRININFFSYAEGGRNVLVKTCKEIALNVKKNDLNLNEINTALVDSQILGFLLFLPIHLNFK